MEVLGIDPGKETGLARVDVGTKLVVHSCFTIRSVRELADVFGAVGHLCPPAAIEWWEYQGHERARGVPHQAEAAGRVAGFLEAHDHPYVTLRRTEVLKGLNLPRNASKDQVRLRVLALTTGARPRNDHEADAIAAAIVGAARHESRVQGRPCESRSRS